MEAGGLTLGFTFFASFLAFFAAFRRLSAPGVKSGPRVRIALGTLLSFGVTLAALWLAPGPWTLPLVAAGAAAGSIGLREPGFTELTLALGRARFWVYLLSVASLAALVFVFVPITTFLTSPGELSIHLDYLVTTNARDAMMMVYLAALLYAMAFTSRMRTVLTLYALGVLLLALVYAYVLPFGYPMMSGLAFEQVPISPLARVPRLLADIAVLVGLAFGIGFALRRFGARPFIVGMVLVNLSLGIAAGIGVRRDLVGGAGGPEAGQALPEQPLHFSRTQPNVLVLFLDRYMGSYVEELLKTDPQLADRLSGFTWYPRTISAGENSIAGVHPMLGGYDYLPVAMNARGKPLRDLSVEAFSILPYNFSRKGYRVNVVSPKGLGFTMAGDCKYLRMDGVNCTHIPSEVSKRMAARMDFPLNDLAKSSYTELLVLLASMRVTPYVAKDVLLTRGPWRRFLDHSAGTTFREWAELKALPDLTTADATESNFNFVSNILAHEPYYMGEDCLPMRERLVVPEAEFRARGHASLFSLQHAVAARCVLLGAADYMDYLKRAGVYDNTRIIIVSDHGIVGPVEDHSTRATAGGTQGTLFVRTRSVLLVKPRGAQGPLRISEEFKPNAETPILACEEIGGCVNPYLDNSRIETRGRDDPFFISLVPWQFSAQEPNAFVIDAQFALVGKDPYDVRSWKQFDLRKRQ